MYFSSETDVYLQEYVLAENVEEKNKIFGMHLRAPFEKLIENLIYVYGFYKICPNDVEALKSEALTNLYEQVEKYKISKTLDDSKRSGSAGFAYFNVIAKNWFIQKAREKMRRNRLECQLQSEIDQENHPSVDSIIINNQEEVHNNSEFWTSLFDGIDEWGVKMTKPNEKKVLEAIKFLLKNHDLIPIYSKKAIYLYLRELTRLNSKQVVMILKKIRNLYSEWKEEFLAEEE